MEKETEKLYMNDMTRQKLYDLFNVARVDYIEELKDWINFDVELNEEEIIITKAFQRRLIENIEDWNEHELSMGFIGPIINIIDFKIKYKLGFFAQRPLSATIDNYEIIGKPDGIIASGGSEPRMPYFSFHEYKKDVNSVGDPAGQNLAAMLVGQSQNQENDVIYGCYVVGRNWYFMALKGKEFAISQDYSATHDDDLIKIVKTLKALRSILLKRLGISEEALTL